MSQKKILFPPRILLATSESFGGDPRTVHLLETLTYLRNNVQIVEFQTKRPSLGRVVNHQFGSVLLQRSFNDVPIWTTWSSRSIAIENFRLAIAAQNTDLSLLNDLMSKASLNATESFLVNQFCIAYEGLRAFLNRCELQQGLVVVAEDIQSALAALLLSRTYEISVFYDAHELYSEAISLFGAPVSVDVLTALQQTEKWVWEESRLVATVSEGLARYISSRSSTRDVLSIPNFSSLAFRQNGSGNSANSPLKYVYFGGVAPFRNVDSLVKCWPSDKQSPQLSLYLQPSKWANHVHRLARHNPNIHVLKPVAPSELIKEMSRYDIGIIPYSYPFPYSWASPNKFGEYVAAGLAILAHPQPFTSQLIDKFGLGLFCNLNDAQELQNCLSSLDSVWLETTRENVKNAFQYHLNWEKVVVPLSNAIDLLLREEVQWPSQARLTPLPFSRSMKLGVVYLDFLIDGLRPLLAKFGSIIERSGLIRIIPQSWIRRLA